MGEIYVTGHRNPDTDSIAASIAYANLRNAIGDRQYKAVRIGSVNDETRHILDLLGLDPPEFVKDMRTQVRDLDFDQPPELTGSVPINLAWTTMRKNEVATLPIINEDGTLYGVISAGDIATFDMETVYSGVIDDLLRKGIYNSAVIRERLEEAGYEGGISQVKLGRCAGDKAYREL